MDNGSSSKVLNRVQKVINPLCAMALHRPIIYQEQRPRFQVESFMLFIMAQKLWVRVFFINYHAQAAPSVRSRVLTQGSPYRSARSVYRSYASARRYTR